MHDAPGEGSGRPSGPRASTAPRHAAPGAPSGAPRAPRSGRPAGSRAAHRHTAERSGPTGPRRGVRRFALAAAVAAAVTAVLVVGLLREGADTAGAGSATGSPAPPAALPAWLRSELPEKGTVTAPAELRAALLGAGLDAEDLPESPPGDRDPGTPHLVLAEARPEGSRLIARFDRGAGEPPLLLTDPAPVEPTDDQLRRRQTLASAVLANPTTRTDGDVREVLTSADVDARLLSLVAALTAREGIGLAAAPVPPGEEAGSAPVRRVLVTGIGGRPVPEDGAATQRLLAWVEAQLAPFAPDTAEVTGDGLLVAFDYVPGADAVVAAATP